MNITSMYIEGFASMRLGRRLWLIIAIKLALMFGVMKLFFFPDYLHQNFADEEARSLHLLETLTQGNNHATDGH
ncbi:MAG: DUF4492 domain-containing protein [Campylobacterales bacterium]|nr:DUF4492 domain-containing protein [Campylobacterales bacterium]